MFILEPPNGGTRPMAAGKFAKSPAGQTYGSLGEPFGDTTNVFSRNYRRRAAGVQSDCRSLRDNVARFLRDDARHVTSVELTFPPGQDVKGTDEIAQLSRPQEEVGVGRLAARGLGGRKRLVDQHAAWVQS